MKLGLSDLLFLRSSTEDAVRAVAEAGADSIEVIYDVPHFMPDHRPSQLGPLREMIDSHGLGVSTHASFWDVNPASHHPEIGGFSLRQAKRSIEACRRLGGEILTLHPGRVAITELDWFAKAAKQRCLEFLDECSAFARDRGVKVAVENISLPFYTCSTLGELGEIVTGREDLGITLDTGHAYLRRRNTGIGDPEGDLAGTIRRLGRKITHVHLHDNRGERDEHLVPGEGDIDFGPIVGALKEINYGGMIVVELFDPGNAREAARAGLERTRRLFGV